MTKEKPGRHRLDRIALEYAEKAFEWGNKVLEIVGDKSMPYDSEHVSRQFKTATAKRWYYEDLCIYVMRNPKVPTEDVKKKLWQDALILAAEEDKKRQVNYC